MTHKKLESIFDVICGLIDTTTQALMHYGRSMEKEEEKNSMRFEIFTIPEHGCNQMVVISFSNQLLFISIGFSNKVLYVF